ncbi:Transcription initiation factor TFIID subunit 6, partial [Operophtera brumata]
MGDSEFTYSSALSLDSMKVIAESIGIANLGDDAAKDLADDVTYRLKQDSLPFRFASGGGRELHFVEEKEIDLSEILSAPPPKVPLDVSVRAHWLSVDGVQPTVPENPPPLSKEAQKLESVDPVCKLSKPTNKDAAAARLKASESVHVKQLATHELSVEQQLYYKEITEACVGSDEGRVKVNVVQNNLALLIYLMRMVKALLDNQSLYLEKYLHELIPSVSTCIVSRQLLFAKALQCPSQTNNETGVAMASMKESEKTPLASLYGAVQGLAELGPEVVKGALSGIGGADRLAAGNLKHQLLKVLAPVVRQLRTPPDLPEDYNCEQDSHVAVCQQQWRRGCGRHVHAALSTFHAFSCYNP